jgi:conserved oligomeric Golgi complex subunit 2
VTYLTCRLQRIDRIRNTLSSDLDHLFSTTVLVLAEGRDEKKQKVNEADKARYMSDLVECLRTYDILGLWRDAEDVLRRDIVRDFVKRVWSSRLQVSYLAQS